MTMVDFFAFPEKCRTNQRIPKTIFATEGLETVGDRKLIQKDVAAIVCTCVLTAEETNLSVCEGAEYTFDCLALLEVTLRNSMRLERIAELCHRAIPYPLLLVFHDAQGRVMLSMAEKRFRKDGRESAVLERVLNTAWHTVETLTDFRKIAGFTLFKRSNFEQLHVYYLQLLEALNCASVTGGVPSVTTDPMHRRRLLTALHQVAQEITAIKAQVKRESQFPRKVELNMTAKRLMKKQEAIVEQLKPSKGVGDE